MEKTDVIKKRFSDLIEDKYKSWKDTRIILDGGTGSGKTYFVLNKIGKYAKECNCKILYLCNRSKLRDQTYGDIKKLKLQDTVIVMTYQSLQNRIKHKDTFPHYDYIIADECHYFTNDALFNEYTDLSYKYLKHQSKNVVIYISATAKVFFHWMKQKEIVTQEHYFSIPKDYSYVDKVYFYDKKYLIPQIDKILEEEKDSKIIVFCNSITRMLELYKKYENQADYAASQNAVKVKDICNEKCVYEHKDGTVTFDKRILVTTKVLDNGINIKDKKVKHIFSEILDADSAIQALGRKRRTSEDDTCTFYLKNYSGQAIQGLINTNEYQLEPVMTYRIKYDEFLNKYGQNRKRIRNNKIFYTKFSNDKDKNNIAFNEMRLNKYLMDNMILGDMKEGSYKSVMIGLIGYSLPDKVEELEINIEEKDGFLEYLKSIEGKWLYSAERKEVVKRFEDIGVKLRRQGINTLNGALQDFYENRYKCRFRNKQIDENGKLTKKSLVDYRRTLEDGSINPMRNKAYWILE
jgi:superfamily II DNA or RNA helicase